MGRRLDEADDGLAQNVLVHFQLKGPFTVQPFGAGHVHNTFQVQDAEGTFFLLQRINHAVFKDVEGMMRNMQRVTQHLRQKLVAFTEPGLTTFELILTKDERLFYRNEAGYWRVLTFVAGGVAYQRTPSTTIAQAAGWAFGQFSSLLRDLPGEPLVETIPQFHHLARRLTAFEQALTADVAQRASKVSAEIAFVHQRTPELLRLHTLIDAGKIPSRITHNDTKLNNVLLDPLTHRARAVVDLDTVMPGTVLHDFGDAIRTVASTAAEDEADLDQVRFHLPFYEAFAAGYLAEVGTFLTAEEIKYLPLSARYMTFIMGVRMLTDHLAGDTYYKTTYPNHNLDRARNQFWLIEQMEEQQKVMVRVVQKLVGL